MSLLASLNSILASAIVLSGCSIAPSESPNKDPSPADRIRIEEAFFRLILRHNTSGAQGHTAMYCIGIGKLGSLTDPDSRLLMSLADIMPHVVPASYCKFHGDVTSKTTRKHSLIFNVESIVCNNSTSCTVVGGYLEGNLGAGGGTYIAERNNQIWTIHSTAISWIS